MKDVNLIPVRFKEARHRRRRARAWFTIFSGYAIALAAGYVGVASALNDGGASASDLVATQRQVEVLDRTASMLKIQLRDAQVKLSIARTVGDQPDWSLLLAALGKLADEQIVLRSCRLETINDSPMRSTPSNAKPTSQPAQASVVRMTLAVSGLGKMQRDVANFVLRLEKLGLFDRVDLVQSSREPIGASEATAFRIECALHNRSASGPGFSAISSQER